MITIPSPKNKKWIISYLGDYFGHLINTFNVDLFHSQGRIKLGKKFNLHTPTWGSIYGAVLATLNSGESGSTPTNTKKIWAIAENSVLKLAESDELESSSPEFEEDISTGLGYIDDGSDIITLKDDSDEELESLQYDVLLGNQGTATFQITGEEDNTKWAQSIKITGYLKELSVSLRKVKTPTDSIKIEICEDNEGVPGDAISSVTKLAGYLTTALTDYTFEKDDWSNPDVYFDPNKTYWLVFSRTGSADNQNFYLVKIAYGGDEDAETDDPYIDGQLLNYNGSTWALQDYTLVTDTFTSDGNWTVPAGITEAVVECWGAGGGSSTNVGGSGGGAYARKLVTGLTPDDVIPVVVGTSAANTDGEDSTFDTNVVVAKGGKSGTNGGAGGSAAGSTGDVKYSGGPGETGTGDRAGGGGAGERSNGGSGLGTYPGVGGEFCGGDGDSRIIGGGAMSMTSSQSAGARGEVRITYKQTTPSGYPRIKSRTFYRQVQDGKPTWSYFAMPPNITAGDTVLALLAYNSNVDISLSGTSWTLLFSQVGHNNNSTLKAYYRVADGDEQDTVFSTSSTTESASMIMYVIQNGDVDNIASKAEITYNTKFDPPSVSLPESKKAIWFAIGSVHGLNNNVTLTAPPANFQSMLFVPSGGVIKQDSTPGGKRGAYIISSERFYEGQTLDPGTYTASTTWNISATIAIPYKENTHYKDLSGMIKTTLPTATERIYVSTTDDIKMLDTEDSQWHSIWKGLLKQKALNSDYPRILKVWGLGEVIFVANDNKIHSISKLASQFTDVEYERIVAPTNYYANWMATTKLMIFTGFTNKDGLALPSLILAYDPYSEYTRTIEIPSGATMGFVLNDICYFINIKGELYAFSGSSYQQVGHMPGYTKDIEITLPHRNGFFNYEGEVLMLWKGIYPYAGGVWRLSDNQFYHYASIDNQITLTRTGALFFDGTNMYCGATYGEVKGIFVDGDADNGWIVFSKIPSPDIKQLWHNIALKYFVPKPNVSEGDFVVKYRTQQSQLGEGVNADIFNGTWVDEDTFNTTATGFNVGDEIIVVGGSGSGCLAHITKIDDTLIDIDEEIGTALADFTFTIENWKKVRFPAFTNKQFNSIASLGDIRSEWIQFKIGIEGDYELEEVQISSVPDLQIDKK